MLGGLVMVPVTAVTASPFLPSLDMNILLCYTTFLLIIVHKEINRSTALSISQYTMTWTASYFSFCSVLHSFNTVNASDIKIHLQIFIKLKLHTILLFISLLIDTDCWLSHSKTWAHAKCISYVHWLGRNTVTFLEAQIILGADNPVLDPTA